ncbi:MAG: hypothetical protein EBZ52_06700, partial [Actinobacteria bacterium]|nr:hypothetical protein [Actinomycetota bacterium]
HAPDHSAVTAQRGAPIALLQRARQQCMVGYAHKSQTLRKPPYPGSAQHRFQRKSVKNSAAKTP